MSNFLIKVWRENIIHVLQEIQYACGSEIIFKIS